MTIGAEQAVLLVDKLTQGRSIPGRAGLVVWITGLSGAGKTTVATRLAPLIAQTGRSCILLDGDGLRDLLRSELGLDPGHDRHQRLSLARLYGRLCADIAARGHDVLCATVSMFQEVRDWNRTCIPNYFEVYLRVPLEELRRRDPKGLYSRTAVEQGAGMVGVTVPAEEPLSPDLVIDHEPGRTPDETVRTIWGEIRAKSPMAAG